MTELDQEVKRNNCNEISDLGTSDAKSLIYKGMYESVILRFLLREAPVG